MQVDTSLAMINSNYNKTFDTNAKNDVLLKEQTDKFEAFFIKNTIQDSFNIFSFFLYKVIINKFLNFCSS